MDLRSAWRLLLLLSFLAYSSTLRMEVVHMKRCWPSDTLQKKVLFMQTNILHYISYKHMSCLQVNAIIYVSLIIMNAINFKYKT
jgi:hypothetical protein